MEYVEGVSIDAFCDERRLSVRDRIRFLMRVMDAVAYAHQHLWRRPRLPRVPARRLKLPPVVARGGQTFYQVQKLTPTPRLFLKLLLSGSGCVGRELDLRYRDGCTGNKRVVDFNGGVRMHSMASWVFRMAIYNTSLVVLSTSARVVRTVLLFGSPILVSA